MGNGVAERMTSFKVVAILDISKKIIIFQQSTELCSNANEFYN